MCPTLVLASTIRGAAWAAGRDARPRRAASVPEWTLRARSDAQQPNLELQTSASNPAFPAKTLCSPPSPARCAVAVHAWGSRMVLAIVLVHIVQKIPVCEAPGIENDAKKDTSFIALSGAALPAEAALPSCCYATSVCDPPYLLLGAYSTSPSTSRKLPSPHDGSNTQIDDAATDLRLVPCPGGQS